MKAKNLGIAFILLATVQAKGMEELPEGVKKLCRNNWLERRISGQKYQNSSDCGKLQKFLFCAQNAQKGSMEQYICENKEIPTEKEVLDVIEGLAHSTISGLSLEEKAKLTKNTHEHLKKLQKNTKK